MGGISFEIHETKVKALEAEIKHLRASELAWKIIAKQNDQWNALPQSEKESALNKALESEVAAGIQKDDEIERLRATIEDAIDTLEAMDLHADNPLYDRLVAALNDQQGADKP